MQENISPRLGLLGLGSRSTLFYVEQLNQRYNAASGGGDFTCPFLLLNADFEDFNPYLPNQFDRLEPTLIAYLETLASLPIAQIILPNITLHECYDRLDLTAINLPEVIHPVLSTLQQLQAVGHQQAILFASAYSMHSAALKAYFNNASITLLKPSQQDIHAIDHIRQQVYASKETLEDIQRFKAMLEHYSKQAPIVIACTELSIVLEADVATNIYDMASIQIETFIKQKQLQPTA